MALGIRHGFSKMERLQVTGLLKTRLFIDRSFDDHMAFVTHVQAIKPTPPKDLAPPLALILSIVS